MALAEHNEAQTRACNAAPCNDEPANCMGRWGDWGECSTTCGGGEQARVYSVSQVARNHGMDCPVDDGTSDTRACNEDPCPAVVSSQFEFTSRRIFEAPRID